MDFVLRIRYHLHKIKLVFFYLCGEANFENPQQAVWHYVVLHSSVHVLQLELPVICVFLDLDKKHELIFNFCLPKGPYIFISDPAKATLTLSGILILILPILDIKIPYKLFRHQLFVFLHLYLSWHLLA